MQFNAKIIIVTHQLYYGAPQALRDFFIKKKAKEVFFIGLPFYNQRNTFIEEYNQGKKRSIRILKRRISIGTLDYFIDILSVIFQISRKKIKYDYYVGAGTLDCLAGLLLKKIGRVNNVIFYSIDFVPIRFRNKALNFIFHQIEIFCIKNSDKVWNVSPRIAEGRKKFLHISEKKYMQDIVPIGIWNDKIKKRPLSRVKKHQVLFMGHLLEKQGVQVVLDALPVVIKKIIDLRFIIVGGGEYKNELEVKVKDLGLEKNVIFTGWISDREQIDEMMSESAIAVATYKPEKKQLYNFTYYADPTKLKDYLGAGLPIVLTDISYNARDIAEKKCGILVKYDKAEIAQAILSFLKDDRNLSQYRMNALNYAKEFDWNRIFEKVTRV